MNADEGDSLNVKNLCINDIHEDISSIHEKPCEKLGMVYVLLVWVQSSDQSAQTILRSWPARYPFSQNKVGNS